MANERQTNDPRAALLDRAQRTALAVGGAVRGKPADTPIQTNAGALLAMGDVVASLLEDARACGGADCMGRSVDGVKLWVTREQFQATEARLNRLERALRAIATSGDSDDAYEMLVDWRETALALRRVAKAALEETTG